MELIISSHALKGLKVVLALDLICDELIVD
jgi:hypothetical protein